MKRPPLACILVVTAVALSACAARGAAQPPGTPRVRYIEVRDLQRFTLPLDPYAAFSVSPKTVLRADGILFEQCMKRFGFTAPTDAPDSAGPPPVRGYERRYGLADGAAAATRGYHLPAAVARTQSAGPSSPPSAAYAAVAQGEGSPTYRGQRVPEGGCAGESRRRLEEGAPRVPDPRLGDRLSYDTYEKAEMDGRVQAVFRQWSACMQHSGFDYSNPSKAINDPAFETGEPTEREKAVAIADVRCKKEVDLINIRASVETAYQRVAYEQNAEACAWVRAYWVAQARNAAQIVAEAQTTSYR